MNECFSKEWWVSNLIIEESFTPYDLEVLGKVVKGFDLERSKQGFGYSFITKGKKATPELSKRINNWIEKNFPNSKLISALDKTYGTVNFLYRKYINEIYTGEETSPYQEYILDNEDKIEEAAEYFNYPIYDMRQAFIEGNEVVMSDDIWSRLENSKSYEEKDLESIHKKFSEEGIDVNQYIKAIKNNEDIPLPLILRYSSDQYYLVGGELILSLYKVMNVIPVVLLASINMDDKENMYRTEYELKELKKKNKTNKSTYIKTLAEFTQECCQDLNIPAPKIKIINHPTFSEQYNSYGSYSPSDNQIHIVIYERTLADVLRSLCHELKHAQQNSLGILTPNAGEDGDSFENEANSYAGKFMREYGRKNPKIFKLKYT